MGDLADILNKKNFAEPPEIMAIKKYVSDHFQAEVSIVVQPTAIVIKTTSSALANTLRLNTQQLIDSCNITKQLIFRIG
jgi:hypothetical protein